MDTKKADVDIKRSVVKPTIKLIDEFKEFAVKGNVIDLAVGVIAGASFGRIVTSLVNDVLMPPLGLLLGRVNFSHLYIDLTKGGYASLEQARAAGAPVVAYGAFLNAVFEFVIVMFVVFLMVRQINRIRRTPLPIVPDTKNCPFCTSAISKKATRCPFCTSQVG